MSSYLQIAQQILKAARRPMGAKAMLDSAYALGIVPSHLHGKTQHKTLQARISEDILTFRERSIFFRTEPGRFFLREFISDTSLPAHYRDPITAKRRSRELHSEAALALSLTSVVKAFKPHEKIPVEAMLELLKTEEDIYRNPKKAAENCVFIWSFVSVIRDRFVLSFRAGRYREDREAFQQRRSIGFASLVDRDDVTLFSMSDFGIKDSGVSGTKIDLDIPYVSDQIASRGDNAEIAYFMWIPESGARSGIVAVIKYHCPQWFEPVRKRLAINELEWLPLDNRINNIDDFDPWSQAILAENGWVGHTHAVSKAV